MSSQKSDEDLGEFVQETKIHEGWVPAFKEDLLSFYNRSIEDVNNDVTVPEKSKILLALSRCPPQNIKVVILGHDPIRDKNLATGFAFSFPKGAFIDENVGQREPTYEVGRSMNILHDVLVDAGYLERGATYDSCHEDWADRGVLLLNASLTYGWVYFPLWKEFVSRLLYHLIKIKSRESPPLFFLCWGTNAKEISDGLLAKLEEDGIGTQAIKHDQHNTWVENSAPVVVFVGDHPTYPKGENNQFAQQARIQFQAIKKWYPDLFTLKKHIPAPDNERQNRTRGGGAGGGKEEEEEEEEEKEEEEEEEERA